jgi:hypothetical protein
MEQRTTIGIDLAKEVFAVCVLNAAGAVVERLKLRRTAFERWLADLTAPCTVAMEACSSPTSTPVSSGRCWRAARRTTPNTLRSAMPYGVRPHRLPQPRRRAQPFRRRCTLRR